MRYTDEQMEALKDLEPYFETAIRASWSRAVPRVLMETCHRIFEEASGHAYPFLYNCAQCQLNLLKDAGVPYFAQKAEKAEKAEKAHVVEATEEPAQPVRKKKVTAKK